MFYSIWNSGCVTGPPHHITPGDNNLIDWGIRVSEILKNQITEEIRDRFWLIGVNGMNRGNKRETCLFSERDGTARVDFGIKEKTVGILGQMTWVFKIK